jgi:predicted nucleic acid-binding protein
MGIVESLRGRRVYLDTNVFIYAVEGVAEHADAIERLFSLIEEGELAACTSELALAEALAKPFEIGRNDIAQVYEAMLAPSAWLSVLAVNRPILVEAARLQARLKLRLPDAIHVATAVAAECTVLLSNDRRIKAPDGLTLVRMR